MDEAKECHLCKEPQQNLQFKLLCDKSLCQNCYDSCMSKIPSQPVINLTILDSFPIIPQQCLQHNKKFKLYCNDCKSLSCSKCIFLHNYHQINTIEKSLKEVFINLKNIEYSALFSYAKENDPGFQLLHEELLNDYNMLRELPTGEMISEGLKIIEKNYLKLVNINEEFANIPVAFCRVLCELGREVLCELNLENDLNWVEWNEKTLHLCHLENMQCRSISYPDSFVAPFYCRTVLLPFKNIFLCGGRKASGEPGLPANFLISYENKVKVTQLPDMHSGRSNHLVLYCKDVVYVIGGCNQKNTYTDSCEKLSLRTLKWEIIASLIEAKDTIGGCSASHLNCLYVIGGRSFNVTRAVEKYDIASNVWMMTSMQMPYDSGLHGVCLFPYQNKALIFAGQAKEGTPIQKACIADFNENTITEIGSMSVKGGCVVDHPKLFSGKVLFYIFEGYTLRNLMEWDQSSWKDLEYI